MAKKKKILHESYDPDKEHKISHINKIFAMQRDNDIIAMLLDGQDDKFINKYVINKYQLKPATAAMYISKCRKVIRERKVFETDTFISLHMARYEEIYARLYEIGAHGMAMSALRAKENLLGMHREGFHMKVSQGEITAVQLQSVNSDYDVNKLKGESKKRFEFLLNKARR